MMSRGAGLVMWFVSGKKLLFIGEERYEFDGGVEDLKLAFLIKSRKLSFQKIGDGRRGTNNYPNSIPKFFKSFSRSFSV
jgi:hypothetical protein